MLKDDILRFAKDKGGVFTLKELIVKNGPTTNRHNSLHLALRQLDADAYITKRAGSEEYDLHKEGEDFIGRGGYKGKRIRARNKAWCDRIIIVGMGLITIVSTWVLSAHYSNNGDKLPSKQQTMPQDTIHKSKP